MMKDKERMRKYNRLEEIKNKQLKAMWVHGLNPGKEKNTVGEKLVKFK